ncbi:CCR4-NOT transcription complex subunit 2 [Homalodisca vitripennis]|nr:CCR4-NOT transcription complex subunit 2 [Homalodisca vitripennis]
MVECDASGQLLPVTTLVFVAFDRLRKIQDTAQEEGELEVNNIHSLLIANNMSSNPMGSMGSFGIPQSRSFGSQGSAVTNFHSVFGGGGGDASTPPLLDLSLSEFPSLTNRGHGDAMPQPSTMPGKQPYGG